MLREVTNADNLTMTYRYDLIGNLALQIDRKGNHLYYTYDDRNLLLSKSVAETGDHITYSYDEVGNRITMTDKSGTSNYSYDGANQLLQIKKDGIIQITYTTTPSAI